MLTKNGYNPETGEYNDSLTGNYLWSSANTREANPDVMTPYSWSGMRYTFANMMMLPGYLSIGNICGRAYNNASVGATAFKALGQGNSFNETSKELYGIDPEDSDKWNVPLLPIGFQDRLYVLRNAIRIMANVRKALKTVDMFLAKNPGWCETQLHRLADMEKGELIKWSNEVFLPYVVRCFWWMVSPAITQATFISKLRHDLLQVASSGDTVTLLSNVSSEDEILSSLGIVAGLDRLRRGQISREEYLQKYGHRGPHEVEMSIPRPSEDPNWINKQLDSLEFAPLDVDTLLQEQRIRYQAALKNLQKNAPKKYVSLLRRLQKAAKITRTREAGRSEGVRAYSVSRFFALRAGALCGLDADIFFLEFEEVVRLLEGPNDTIAQIPARKTAYNKFLALPQYPTIILGHFDPVVWAADPNRRTDIYDTTGRIQKRFTSQIKGLPGSAGQVEGRVRIVNSPEEGEGLQPGEILVAATTNVGWTPIFPRVAAVITDVGAPLSHAAIVARELGIPAVVGCFNATTVLKTGDRVHVDGGQGTVEIIERAT